MLSAARSRRVAVVAALLGTALAAVPAPARADEPGPGAERAADREEQAKAAVRRGLAAFARGDAQTALEEYRRAEALVPDANVPYRYAAEALVSLGRIDEAIASLETYLAMKPDVSDGPAVRARLATLRALRQSKIVLECDAPLVSARLDGGPPEPRACPVELTVAPGEHVVVLSAEGRIDTTTRVTMTPGAVLRAGVRLLPRGGAPSLAANGSVPPPSRGAPLRTVGFVALGAGAALLATGLVLDLAVLGPKLDDLRDSAARGDPSTADDQSSARTLRAVTLGGYLAGAAVAATGAVLVLVSPRADVRAGVGPRGEVSATATLRF